MNNNIDNPLYNIGDILIETFADNSYNKCIVKYNSRPPHARTDLIGDFNYRIFRFINVLRLR